MINVRVERWDELPLEKITEMVSRKVIRGNGQTIAQIFLKKGTYVPLHSHEAGQMIYVLEGLLRFVVGQRLLTVGEGEVLHVPAGLRHQAKALDDSFQIVVTQILSGETPQTTS